MEEFTFIGACRDLTDLTINVPDPLVANDGIAHLGKLEKLEVFYNPQTPYSGPGMSKMSAKLARTLTRLTFGSPSADSSGAVEVAISKFPLLVEFHFRGEATAASVAQIKKLSALNKLTLHQATLTPAHISAISGCKALTELTIGNGSLTSTDISELKKLKLLSYLKIYDNGIQMNATEMLTTLPQLKTLTKLDLPESQFTTDQAEELRKLMPNCAIALIKRYD